MGHASRQPGLDITDRFDLLYVDPPWRYGTDIHMKSTKNVKVYDTMALDDIISLSVEGRSVPELAADDSVLCLWVTVPKLREGFTLLEAWGFTYRMEVVWHKGVRPFGGYAQIHHESMLICTRGKGYYVKGAQRMWSAQCHHGTKRRHSEKPKEMYALLERQFPDPARRLELFARNTWPGWVSWGNEINPEESMAETQLTLPSDDKPLPKPTDGVDGPRTLADLEQYRLPSGRYDNRAIGKAYGLTPHEAYLKRRSLHV